MIRQRFPNFILALLLLVFQGCSTDSNSIPEAVLKQADGAATGQKNSNQPMLNPPATAVEKPGVEAAPITRIRFDEVGQKAGLSIPHYPAAHGQFRLVETMGSGVGLIDFDRDGKLDIFIGQGADIPKDATDKAHAAQLYRNNGDGTFEDVAQKAGVDFRGFAQGIAVGDYDGDGQDDIYVSGFQSSALYRNRGDGTFEERSEKAGLKNNGWATSAAFADLDRDGDLDLYVVRYLANTVDADGRPTVTCNALPGQIGYCPPLAHNPESDSLYRNNGDGTFTDIGPQIGLSPADGNGLGLAIADFDNDSNLDIFVANDKTPCRFYHNLGEMKFEETGLAWGLALNETGEPTAAMGVAVGDADNDGLLDLLVTNFYEEGATFYRNLGKGSFQVATSRARLKSPTRGRLGFGTGFTDFDNDGQLDLFIANGHVNDVRPLRMPYQMPAQLFRNTGGARFDDLSNTAGAYFQKAVLGRGAAFGDFDNDGRVDILVTHNDAPPALLKNQPIPGDENKSLRLRLSPAKVAGKAVSPVGCTLTIQVKHGQKLVRQVFAGSSYLSSHDQTLTIGVGPVSQVTAVEIRWPSGKVETWKNLATGKLLELAEGGSVGHASRP